MNNIKNVKVTIEDIFNYEPKPPFSVKLDLFSPDNVNVSTLFNKIKCWFYGHTHTPSDKIINDIPFL